MPAGGKIVSGAGVATRCRRPLPRYPVQNTRPPTGPRLARTAGVTVAAAAMLSGAFPYAAPPQGLGDSASAAEAANSPNGFLEALLAPNLAAGADAATRNSPRLDGVSEGPEPGQVFRVPSAAVSPPVLPQGGRGEMADSAGLGLPAVVAQALPALAAGAASVQPAEPPVPAMPVSPHAGLDPFPRTEVSNAPPANSDAEVPTAAPEALRGPLSAASAPSSPPVPALGSGWPVAPAADPASAAGAAPAGIPRGELALAVEATQRPPAAVLEAWRAPALPVSPGSPGEADAAAPQPLAGASARARREFPGAPCAGSSLPHTPATKVHPQVPPEAAATGTALSGTPLAARDPGQRERSPEAVGGTAPPAREPELAGAAHNFIPTVRSGSAPAEEESGPGRPARATPATASPAGGLPVPGPGDIRTSPGAAGPSDASVAAPARPPTGEAASRTGPAAAVRRIELRLARPHAETLTVEVAERRGRIELALRTPDRELAASLGEQAAEIVRRLEAAGFRANAWTPPAAFRGAEPGPEPTAQAAPDFDRNGADPWRQDGGRNPEERGGQDPDPEPSPEEFFSLSRSPEEKDL